MRARHRTLRRGLTLGTVTRSCARAAAHLREHDDREQFLAGVDLFLAGIATL